MGGSIQARVMKYNRADHHEDVHQILNAAVLELDKLGKEDRNAPDIVLGLREVEKAIDEMDIEQIGIAVGDLVTILQAFQSKKEYTQLT